jgi:outer membrane protein assembly factor BamB
MGWARSNGTARREAGALEGGCYRGVRSLRRGLALATAVAVVLSGQAAWPQDRLHAARAGGPLQFETVWQMHIWGRNIGRTGLIPADLEGDGVIELVVGTATSSTNDRWMVVRADGNGEYDIVWSSPVLTPPISRIAVHRIGNAWKVFVGRTNGRMLVYDGATRALEREIQVASTAITAILFADADNDGTAELVATTTSGTFLLEPETYSIEAFVAYGGASVAIGNVDADSRNEIVLSSGFVVEVEAGTATVEWNWGHPYGTGWIVELDDLDGDGMDEIVSARGWDYIDVFDADLRTRKLLILTSHNVDALLLADVTGDGRSEVVYGDAQGGEVHAIDAATGTELWQLRNPQHGISRIAIADVDADGALELVWGVGGSSSGEDYFLVHDVATLAPEFRSLDLLGPFAAVTLGDVDNDGSDELVTFSWESESGFGDGVLHVFDATTFALERRSETELFEGYAWTGIHDVAIDDVDGDHENEILVATDRLYDGALYVLDGKTGTVEERYFYHDGSPLYALHLADLDGDGRREVIAGGGREHTGSPGIFVYVIDGATGAVVWQELVSAQGLDVHTLETADLTGDGRPEVVASLGDVFVIDGATRALTRSLQTGYRGLALGDTNGDGGVEIWAGTTAGQIVRMDPTTLARLGNAWTVCTTAVNALALRNVPGLTGTMQFACDDAVGILDIATGTVLWRSDPLARPAAFGANLVVAERGYGRTLLIAGTGLGVTAFGGYGTADPDVDADEIANHLDNCPETANLDQADADADGVGDACDTDTRPSTLHLGHVRLRSNARGIGSFQLEATIDDDTSTLAADLLGGTSSISIADGGAFDVTVTPTGCEERGRGIVRCRSPKDATPSTRLVLRPVRDVPSSYTVSARVTQIPLGGSLPAPPAPPVSAAWTHGGTTRPATIDSCRAKSLSIRCDSDWP